jgi:RimJ/RimL family protein N-acetyltransferase
MLRDLRLQLLEPGDEPALAALFAANDVPEVTRWFDPFPLTPETARELSHHRGRDLYWGKDDLVGFAMVRGWDGGHPHPAYGCFVDRHQRGAGLGVATTGLVLAELQRRGIPEVRARVHAANYLSLRMLVANGFQELERRAGRVLLVAHPGSSR